MAKRLDLKDVDIYYGDFHAVQNVNLSVPPQSVTAFIGPSGCGKSTVLRTLNRMHEVTPGARVTGEILLDGENIYGPKIDPVAVRNTIGMVFQKANPFPTMSIEENVVAGLRLAGEKNKKKLKEVAERSLRGANLWDEVKDRLQNPGGGLSGGHAQRLQRQHRRSRPRPHGHVRLRPDHDAVRRPLTARPRPVRGRGRRELHRLGGGPAVHV